MGLPDEQLAITAFQVKLVLRERLQKRKIEMKEKVREGTLCRQGSHWRLDKLQSKSVRSGQLDCQSNRQDRESTKKHLTVSKYLVDNSHKRVVETKPSCDLLNFE